MKIHLPNSAFLGNIDPFLQGFDPGKEDELVITSNKRWISVHPMVLSMLAALGLDVSPENVQCDELTARSKHYLERMGLFDFLGIESGIEIEKHEAAGRFVPLTQIKNAKELSKFIKDVTPLLHLDPLYAEPLRYVLSELIRNVIEHSLAKKGAIVSAQYYSRKNTIRIGIADTGVGIWQTIKTSYNPKNDLEAIRLALTPGITGTTKREGGTEYNAGAGLFFTKSIASANKDFLVIYSGKAMYKLLKRQTKRMRLYADPFDDRHSSKANLPFWKGTVVGIDMNLDRTQAFSSLLKAINETYRVAIKERKKAKHKKPQFI